MRFARFGLLLGCVLFSNFALAQQPATSNQTTSDQPTGDPQAVAVVQAAIAALGGATAIGRAQGWTFQATLEGPVANASVSYAMGWDEGPPAQIALSNGKTMRGRPGKSLFVPAIIGSVLLNELQDSNFLMRNPGTTTIDSKPVTAISFSVKAIPDVTSQTWWFDNATSLPVRVDFHLPAEVGSRMSFVGIVDLSDYRSVAGVMHPFRIVTQFAGRPAELITLQSVSPSMTAPAAIFDGASGDLP